jgi:hypothetical protein
MRWAVVSFQSMLMSMYPGNFRVLMTLRTVSSSEYSRTFQSMVSGVFPGKHWTFRPGNPSMSR